MRAFVFAMGAALIATLPLAARAGAQASTNLLVNPSFTGADDGRPAGWAPMWMRDAGSGEASLDQQTTHGGAHALKVVHRGGNDWAVEQTARIPVKPGDIYSLGGWVKSSGPGGVQLSVVTRRADDQVQEWTFGGANVAGAHDWQEIRHRFIAPPACATVQFRITGEGAVTAWIDDVSLARTGSMNDFQNGLHGKRLRVVNRSLELEVDAETGLFSLADRRNHRTWMQRSFGDNIVVKAAESPGAGRIRLTLWDVASDTTYQATLAIDPAKPEVTVALEGDGAVGEPVAFPRPFVTEKGTWLIIPMNEGISYPVDDPAVPPMQLVAYGGHGICMPWFGAIDPRSGAGIMAILNTPDDARIDITRQGLDKLYIRPLWEATRGRFGYTRHITYVVFDRGGYVAQAKRYRRYAQETGLFKTLAQKRSENPNVDLLVGAANIWNWDMDKVALCREMKSLGMSRILWSSGGNSEQLAEINRMGYLTSRYDIYQDVWPPNPRGLRTAGWPEDLVWLPNGDWMRGWADIEHKPDGTQVVYEGGVISSSRGLARAKQEVPADLAKNPYHCRFIDTTTASPFREDYNPAHPLTRSEDRKYKMALLDFCSKDMKLVVGTETGIDPSVPFVDYYEGMLSLGPYRLPDAGRDMLGYKAPTPEFLRFQVGPVYRIPLWELVYHECVVAQWYWGDYNNKAPEVWDRRDLFNILYGTPPMFLFDHATWEKDRERFASSYKAICPLVRQLGYDEMLSHEFLTADHTVQRTHWRSGKAITVNFGDTPYSGPDGRQVKPMSSTVTSR